MRPVFRPRAFAPLTVAISKACRAVMAIGSWFTPLWRTAASFMSANRSVLLWELTPSVPRAAFTPALRMAGMGATPEPSFRLE